MYHQTRYCSASREKRDTSRVAARVNAVSASTDRRRRRINGRRSVADRLSAGPGRGPRQHGAYLPPRRMINCDVVLYDRRSAYTSRPDYRGGGGGRGGRTELGSRADSRITAVEGAYSSCNKLLLLRLEKLHGRVNKIVARDAVYYPPLRYPCVCVCVCVLWEDSGGR